MGKELAFPRTLQQSLEKINRRQDGFSSGMVSDIPASEIPEKSVAWLENCIAFEKYIEARPGCLEFSPTLLPYLAWSVPVVSSSESGYLRWYPAANSFENICKALGLVDGAGNPILSELSGMYAVSSIQHQGAEEPYYEDDAEQMLTVDTDTNGTYFTTTNPVQGTVSIRDQVFGAGYNNYGKFIVVQYGQSILIKSMVGGVSNAYQKLVFAGSASDLPSRSRSNIVQHEKETIIFNSNGIYRILTDNMYFFKANDVCDQLPVGRNPKAGSMPYKRNYTYSMSVIDSTAPMFADRQTAGAVVVQESNSVTPTLDDHTDAVILGATAPIGPGNQSYDSLTGGNMHTIISDWIAITNGGFHIVIDGLGRDIICDFSSISTLTDVINAITNALKVYWPNAYALLVTNLSGNPAIFVTPNVVGSVFTTAYITAPSGATDITAYLALGSGSAIHSAVSKLDSQLLVMGLNTPRGGRKWTHYSLYGSLDVGPNGLVLGNLQDLLVWLADIPVIKVWYGNIVAATGDGGYMFQSLDGSFSRYDECVGAGSSALRQVTFSTGTANEHITAIADSGGFRTYNQTSQYAELKNTSSTATDIAMAAGAAKCAVVSITSGIVSVTSGSAFTADDIGRQLFLSTGKISPIASFDSVSGHATLGDTTINVAACGAAWDSDCSSNRVQVANARTMVSDMFATLTAESPASFDSLTTPIAAYNINDNNGLLDFTQAVAFGGTSCTLNDVLSTTGNSNMYFGVMPRTFNDTIADSVLSARIQSGDPNLTLQSRFAAPMTSSPVAAVSGDFCAVVQPGTASFDYCPLSSTFKKHIGYKNPQYQTQDTIYDVCVDARVYGFYIVFFCKKGIWSVDSSSYTNTGITSLDQNIFVMAQAQKIDSTGFSAVGGIADIAVGQSIVFCSDGGFRVFNGQSFSSTNIADGKIWKKLKALYPYVSMYYDDHAGLLLYGSEQATAPAANTINGLTGKCYRLAVLPSQGSYFASFSGVNMVWPEPFTSGISVDAPGGELVSIILDSRTGRWFIPFTYESYSGASVSRTYQDKFNTDISGYILMPEHKGTLESYQMEHLESHAYFRPYDESVGYPSNFAVNAAIYADGAIAASAATLFIPIEGTTVFDRKVMARRIQLEWIFPTSNWRMVAADSWYAGRDSAGSTQMDQRDSSETVWQSEIATALMWVTRGTNPSLNRVTGNLASIPDGATPDTGPDGQSGSAVTFDEVTTGIQAQGIGTASGSFTIMLGYKLPVV